MWRVSRRYNNTLSAVADRPAKNLYNNLLVVVVECSEPTRITGTDWDMVRLKVIDPTFNFTLESARPLVSFHKYANVFVTVRHGDPVPQINQVGDLMKLYFARFYASKLGELICYVDSFCDWRIYDQDSDFQKPICHSVSRRDEQYSLSSEDVGYATYVAKWAQKLFGATSVKDVLWWKGYKKAEGAEGKTEQKGVNSIVKCTGLSGKEKMKRTATFQDKYGNHFSLQLTAQEQLAKGRHYRLGNMNAIPPAKGKGEVQLNRGRYFVLNALPQSSLDVQNFGKMFHEVLEDKRQILEEETEHSQPKGYWEARSAGWATVIAKRLVDAQKLDFSQALAALKNHLKHLNKVFILEGQFGGVQKLANGHDFSRLIIQSGELASLDNHGLKNMESAVVINLVFTLNSNADETPLPIYISTIDTLENPFEAWGLFPNVHDIEAWQGLKECVYKEFYKRLGELAKKGAKVRLAVRLQVTKSGKPFFKLVDTKF